MEMNGLQGMSLVITSVKKAIELPDLEKGMPTKNMMYDEKIGKPRVHRNTKTINRILLAVIALTANKMNSMQPLRSRVG